VFFGENSNAGKVKINKFYLLALILLIEKDATSHMTLTSHYGKFNPENMYQTLSESASFKLNPTHSLTHCCY